MKEKIKKQKPFSFGERQGRNWKTLPIFIKGKTREKLKNIIHIQIKKYKGRTEYHDPYLYRDRQRKNKRTLPVFI